MLKGKSILLCVTGCIAAYKSASLCSMLIKAGCDVNVILSKNATNFITPTTFEALTGNRTITDTFDRNHEFSTEHISLAKKSDLVIVAPATANIIAKLAHGLADDMLTTTVLACDCPKLISPAMNTGMFNNPVTQDNISILKKYKWDVIEPATGRLACGDVGDGKMPEPDHLFAMIERALNMPKDMTGLDILVTAGPTRESIDPVRFISNNSSGRMGYAVAKMASNRGADVTLISGPVNIAPPVGIKDLIPVVSAQDMYDAVTNHAKNKDIIVMSAAIADYTPASYSEHKIKKSDDDLSIPLSRTHDILKKLGADKHDGQILCGFAMETENIIGNAKKKLASKNLDIIAANNTLEEGAGFNASTNHLTLITEEEEIDLPLMSKEECADRLLDEILKLRE